MASLPFRSLSPVLHHHHAMPPAALLMPGLLGRAQAQPKIKRAFHYRNRRFFTAMLSSSALVGSPPARARATRFAALGGSALIGLRLLYGGHHYSTGQQNGGKGHLSGHRAFAAGNNGTGRGLGSGDRAVHPGAFPAGPTGSLRGIEATARSKIVMLFPAHKEPVLPAVPLWPPPLR